MQIHELPNGTLSDNDYAAIDNGSTNRKLSLKSAINALITAGISAMQSALATAQSNITALQNSMSTANTNIGSLQTKVGSASTSNVGDGSLAGAVGNTVMGTAATTLSGAIKEHEDQIGGTDISDIGDGTITGAIRSFVDKELIIDSGPTSTDPVVVPASTYTSVAHVTLTTGIYIVLGRVSYPANSTGIRYTGLGATVGTQNWSVYHSASSAGITRQEVSVLQVVTSGSLTFNLIAYQNSGAAMNITSAELRAFKLV